jgi:hypothetical protein
LHDRVLKALRTRRFQELSPREQRHTAKQFRHATPAQMQEFLAIHPANWLGFATECFRDFEQLSESPEFAGYTRLLCLAPPSVAFVHHLGRPQDVVGISGPTNVARKIKGANVCEARNALQGRGFDPAWSFTAVALAMWTKLFVDKGATFGRVWGDVARDLVVESMLLPRLEGRLSWFSPEPRPVRVRGALAGSAVVVASLIQAAFASGVDPSQWSDFTERLLRSEFRDPRVPPDSLGWSKVRGFDPAAYNQFLEHLISEDLEVFFNHAMSDLRRKQFWLRYLKSIRRTVCVLDRSKHDQLTRQFAGADKKLTAAISRARQFTRRTASGGVHAFCLYFDSIVVVEFSETGNAAQIYQRAEFERRLGQPIHANQVSDHAKLKQPGLALERILHMGDEWEYKAQLQLQEQGIYPATPPKKKAR